jgi:hypothetical protein
MKNPIAFSPLVVPAKDRDPDPPWILAFASMTLRSGSL